MAEGYKRTSPHRVEIFRGGRPRRALCDPGEALALVTDAPLGTSTCSDSKRRARWRQSLAARLDTLRRY